MASISLKGIYKIYPGDVTAVSAFNLEIEDKEFITVSYTHLDVYKSQRRTPRSSLAA